MLEGFEILSPVAGAPTLSVNKTGLSFNKATVEKLQNPSYVQFLVNRLTRQIALVPCLENDEGSRSFLKDGRSSKNGVRWNNCNLKTELSNLMNWDLDVEGKKIEGKYISKERALVFDLNKATRLSTRKRGGADD